MNSDIRRVLIAWIIVILTFALGMAVSHSGGVKKGIYRFLGVSVHYVK
jgi:hypothetical protein